MVLFHLRRGVCDEKENLEGAEGEKGVALFVDFTELRWSSMPKEYAKAMTCQSLGVLAIEQSDR